MRSHVMAILAACTMTWTADASAAATARPVVAVVDFDYLDTSGEARDQSAEHQARLQQLRSRIEQDLAGTDSFRIVQLPCSAQGCSAGNTEPGSLVAAAKAAGADLLVVGGVHKMSTLVQNGKFDVFDLERGKLVLSQKITFRGDTDLAYDRAGAFVARTLASLPPLAQ